MAFFQERIYQVVKKIPRGETMSYREVSEKAGFPRAWRAVGNILNQNRSSRVPCHRVIRSNGKIGGYKKSIKNKIKLLKKESTKIKHGKILF